MRPIKLLYIINTKVVVALSLEEGMLIVPNCTKLWTVHICFGIDNHSLRRASGWGSWISVISSRQTEKFSDLRSRQLKKASIRFSAKFRKLTKLAFTLSKLNTQHENGVH